MYGDILRIHIYICCDVLRCTQMIMDYVYQETQFWSGRSTIFFSWETASLLKLPGSYHLVLFGQSPMYVLLLVLQL